MAVQIIFVFVFTQISFFFFFLPLLYFGFLAPYSPSGCGVWASADALVKAVCATPLLTSLCDALRGIDELADEMDILRVMLNFNGGNHIKPGYVVLPGLRGGVFPADPEQPHKLRAALFRGDCGEPNKSTAAVEALNAWRSEGFEVVAVGIHAPGTGKTKAAMDFLRVEYGFYLDLTDASKDWHWKQAWEGIQLIIKGFSNRLYTAMKVEAKFLGKQVPTVDGSLRVDLAIDALRPLLPNFAATLKKTVELLQANLFNQVAAVLLGRAIVLQQLNNVLKGRLTPNIWAIFQTTSVASDVFVRCSAAVLLHAVPQMTALGIMQKVLSFNGQPYHFTVFCDEFQELSKTDKEYPPVRFVLDKQKLPSDSILVEPVDVGLDQSRLVGLGEAESDLSGLQQKSERERERERESM